MPPSRFGLLLLAGVLASCDLYYPDHRIDVSGTVRDENGGAAAGLTVTLRRQRLAFDRALASAVTDGAGVYRVTYRLEGCSQFDGFSVVAERAAGGDTVRVREEVACADEVQTVDLVVPTIQPRRYNPPL